MCTGAYARASSSNCAYTLSHQSASLQPRTAFRCENSLLIIPHEIFLVCRRVTCVVALLRQPGVCSCTSAEKRKATNKHKTVDVKVIDHKGINTVVTPKHVLDHNNVTEHASNECPKDEAGRVCSDNGKCDELIVGTEDVDNKLTQKGLLL